MDYQKFLGIDAGKTEHHATALNKDSGLVHDRPMPQPDPKSLELLDDLAAKHGHVLVVVDRPKTIGTLVVAVAQQLGIQVAELSMLCGFGDDLAAQIAQIRNRLRGLLTQIHPSLERVLRPWLAHPAVVDLLGTYPTPAALVRAGRGHVRTRLKKRAPRLAVRLTDDIFVALAEQTTTVAGTNAAEHVVGRLAAHTLPASL